MADAPPPPFPELQQGDYGLYGSRAGFKLADFLYRKERMSGYSGLKWAQISITRLSCYSKIDGLTEI